MAKASRAKIDKQLQQGRALLATSPEQALLIYEKILHSQPKEIVALVDRGFALQRLGKNDEALESYRKALKLEPGNIDALNNSGILLSAAGKYDEAIAAYSDAIKLRPEFVATYNNRGTAYNASNKANEAIADYQRAIVLKPDYRDALNSLLHTLMAQGRHEEALDVHGKLIALWPDDAMLHNNRGTTLSSLNRHAEALAAYDQALTLKPAYPDAFNNRAVTLQALGRHNEALPSFFAAIKLNPDYVGAHFNLALAWLRTGNFEEGWREHEWRWKKPSFASHIYPFTSPRWTGAEDVAGKTLLLYSEQGLGDVIQFVRYANLLEQRGAKLIFFVPEALKSILKHSYPNVNVFSKVDSFPPHDFHCPLLSLPLAFNTRLESIPANIPYLSAEPGLKAVWATRMPPRKGLRVGLVWSGNITHSNDQNRSLPLRVLRPLLETPNCTFISLQKEIRASDEALLSSLPQVHRMGELVGDFADTAAIIANLDLVISVDTSVAHLAGAMGKPVWLMLPYISDWRWLIGKAETPWYPAARLYWQERHGSWATVVNKTTADLASLAADQQTLGVSAEPETRILSPNAALHYAASLQMQGNLKDAEAIYQGVLKINPQDFDALHMIGVIRLREKRHHEAIDLIRQALKSKPDNPEALGNLATVLRVAGRASEALECYDHAIRVTPESAGLYAGRAVILLNQKRYTEALADLDATLSRDPNNVNAMTNRGVALHELQRFDEAMAAHHSALKLKPDSIDALNNMGLTQLGMNQPYEAMETYQHILPLAPERPATFNNLGLALSAQNLHQDALAHFHRAAELDPNYVDAHWNGSLLSLALGDYAKGWAEYEWRWKKPEFAPHKRDYPTKLWLGEDDISGKAILVYFEQGLGDTLQFVRYVKVLEQRGAKVFLAAPDALLVLLRSSFPNLHIVYDGETLPGVNFHCPLLTLPHACRTTVATIPVDLPYLAPPTEYLTKWQKRLPAGEKPKVGLVWAGNPKHSNDRNRSVPTQKLLPLLNIPGIDFYSLQKEVRAEDLHLLSVQPSLTLLGEELTDMADTAAAITQMDLVISVDTSVAHLAGGLGKPVWILLSFSGEWRWLTERSDSPWYPTATLLRQSVIGDWTNVVEELDVRLKALASKTI